MNSFIIELCFLLICYSNGLKEDNTYLNRESMDLETLPLEKLLEMKKELREKDYATRRRAAEAAATAKVSANEDGVPSALAVQRRADLQQSSSTSGNSVQTAFQMSLTVLSFLAFGGYVVSLVSQNMRKTRRAAAASADGTTAPQPLRTVVVNQNRRPALRPTGSTVGFGRRKRSQWLAPLTR